MRFASGKFVKVFRLRPRTFTNLSSAPGNLIAMLLLMNIKRVNPISLPNSLYMFINARHAVRNLGVSKVCKDIDIKHRLLPVNGETFG